MHGSRVSGAIQEKESRPPLHLDVVAIEKGAFGSPSITVSQLLLLYVCVFVCFLKPCAANGKRHFVSFQAEYGWFEFSVVFLLKSLPSQG